MKRPVIVQIQLATKTQTYTTSLNVVEVYFWESKQSLEIQFQESKHPLSGSAMPLSAWWEMAHHFWAHSATSRKGKMR